MIERKTPWTRGPWEAMDGNLHHGPFVVETGGNVVADFYTRESDDGKINQYPELHCGAEAYANARLVAKAPELVEALRANTGCLEGMLLARSEMTRAQRLPYEARININRTLLAEIEEWEDEY